MESEAHTQESFVAADWMDERRIGQGEERLTTRMVSMSP